MKALSSILATGILAATALFSLGAHAASGPQMSRNFADFEKSSVEFLENSRNKKAIQSQGDTEGMNAIIQRLAKGSGLTERLNNPYPIIIRVQDESQRRSIEVPAANMRLGVLSINLEMLEVVKSEDEAAAVLGHEMLHHTLAHDLVAYEKSQSWIVKFISNRSVGTSNPIVNDENIYSEILGKIRTYTKDNNEAEVDEALPYLLKNAGYDPMAIVELNQRILERTAQYPPVLMDGHTRKVMRERTEKIYKIIQKMK